jgi:hypothetical protein
MPLLVKGHLRFTDEDYALTEHKLDCETKYSSTPFLELLNLLEEERLFLSAMKEKKVLKRFNTQPNIKKSLARSLLLLTALAQNEGYELKELL